MVSGASFHRGLDFYTSATWYVWNSRSLCCQDWFWKVPCTVLARVKRDPELKGEHAELLRLPCTRQWDTAGITPIFSFSFFLFFWKIGKCLPIANPFLVHCTFPWRLPTWHLSLMSSISLTVWLAGRSRKYWVTEEGRLASNRPKNKLTFEQRSSRTFHIA